MPETKLGFIHKYVPPREPGGRTLLLLHGTGGDERDLLPMGQDLAPGAGLLSPRGKVLENGMPRFFRRLAMGVFDLEDLRHRTHELAGFVAEAARAYGFDPAKVIALGYSNGANIAASLLLLSPGTLSAAVLLRPMVPLVPEPLPALTGVPVLIAGGRQDPIVPPEETERLVQLLRQCGAAVDVAWAPGGHQLSGAELEQARLWLAKTGGVAVV